MPGFLILGEHFGSLYEFNFEISMLSLSTLIGLLSDIISKCVNILPKPNEPKVSSAHTDSGHDGYWDLSVQSGQSVWDGEEDLPRNYNGQ